MFTIKYESFLQTIKRTFKTRALAEKWLHQIGRKDLIDQIKETKKKQSCHIINYPGFPMWDY